MQSAPFIEDARDKPGKQIDEEEIKAWIEKLEAAKHQKEVSKRKLAEQIDRLDVTGPHYDAKYDDYQSRLDRFYDDIAATKHLFRKKRRS